MGNLKDWNVKQLEDADASGVTLARFQKETGFQRVPVVTFWQMRYAILWHDVIHPGDNRAEVINLTEFDRDSAFVAVVSHGQQKIHTEGYAWVFYPDEGDMGLLTLYNGALHDCAVHTAVLSYRIMPPTWEAVQAVAEELVDDAPGWRLFEIASTNARLKRG